MSGEDNDTPTVNYDDEGENFPDDENTDGKDTAPISPNDVKDDPDANYRVDFPEGTYYGQIDIRSDEPRGQGEMTYKNGDVYRGDWFQGQKGGRGIMFFANGEIYDGEWEYGKMNGNGIFTYSDGSRWEGEWSYGKRKNGKYTDRSEIKDVKEREVKIMPAPETPDLMNVLGKLGRDVQSKVLANLSVGDIKKIRVTSRNVKDIDMVVILKSKKVLSCSELKSLVSQDNTNFEAIADNLTSVRKLIYDEPLAPIYVVGMTNLRELELRSEKNDQFIIDCMQNSRFRRLEEIKIITPLESHIAIVHMLTSDDELGGSGIWKNLKRLYVSQGSLLGNKFFEELITDNCCPNLQKLSIESNLDDKTIQNISSYWKNIEYLYISSNSMTNETLRYFSETKFSPFPSLISLGLVSNKITDDGIKYICRRGQNKRVPVYGDVDEKNWISEKLFPELKFLELNIKITDVGLRDMSKANLFPKLVEFNLKGEARYGNVGLLAITQDPNHWKELDTLSFDATNMSVDGFANISQNMDEIFPNLENLEIRMSEEKSEHDVSDLLHSCSLSFPKLKKFTTTAPITSDIFTEFKNWKYLEYVDIQSGNMDLKVLEPSDDYQLTSLKTLKIFTDFSNIKRLTIGERLPNIENLTIEICHADNLTEMKKLLPKLQNLTVLQLEVEVGRDVKEYVLDLRKVGISLKYDEIMVVDENGHEVVDG